MVARSGHAAAPEAVQTHRLLACGPEGAAHPPVSGSCVSLQGCGAAALSAGCCCSRRHKRPGEVRGRPRRSAEAAPGGGGLYAASAGGGAEPEGHAPGAAEGFGFSECGHEHASICSMQLHMVADGKVQIHNESCNHICTPGQVNPRWVHGVLCCGMLNPSHVHTRGKRLLLSWQRWCTMWQDWWGCC